LDRVAKCCSGNTAPTIFIGIYQRGLKRAGSVALYTHVTQYCLQPGFPIITRARVAQRGPLYTRYSILSTARLSYHNLATLYRVGTHYPRFSLIWPTFENFIVSHGLHANSYLSHT